MPYIATVVNVLMHATEQSLTKVYHQHSAIVVNGLIMCCNEEHYKVQTQTIFAVEGTIVLNFDDTSYTLLQECNNTQVIHNPLLSYAAVVDGLE
jgi:hypothetical protein